MLSFLKIAAQFFLQLLHQEGEIWEIPTFIEPILWTLSLIPSMYYETLAFRYRPRFFEQVGHQTTHASIENKQFFH